jgi:hypothetical protein
MRSSARGASKDAWPGCRRAVALRGPLKRRPPKGDGDGLIVAQSRHCERSNDGGKTRASSSRSDVKQQAHLRLLAADSARALLSASRPLQGKGAGKAGRRLAPAGRCAIKCTRKCTTARQVKPETSGLPCAVVGTAYFPRSPRRRIRACLRRLANWRCASPGRAPRTFARLDRSDDGRDHAFLPYAGVLPRHRASSPRASQASSAVRTTRLARRSRGSAQSITPPCGLASAPTLPSVHRSPVRGS